MGTDEMGSQHTDSRLPGQVLGVVATPVGRGVVALSENAVGRLTFDVRVRAQVEALWQARANGETGEEIGVSFRFVVRYIHKTGGMREPTWKDTARYLNLEERIEIKVSLHEKVSVKETASRLSF